MNIKDFVDSLNKSKHHKARVLRFQRRWGKKQ